MIGLDLEPYASHVQKYPSQPTDKPRLPSTDYIMIISFGKSDPHAKCTHPPTTKTTVTFKTNYVLPAYGRDRRWQNV
jgi:hypothetical protein